MIKGIGKQVVVLTTPDSKIYEQAIFILKSGKKKTACDQDMVREAEKIINTHIYNSAMLSTKRLNRNWLPVLLTSIAVSVLIGVSVLLFTVL